MSRNANQGQDPNQQDAYGGYAGYGGASGAAKQVNDPLSNARYDEDDHYGPGQGQGQAQQQQFSYGQQQQQQYQPPQSARKGKHSTSQNSGSTSTGGMQARTKAVLSYFFVWVSGLFFLVFERKDRLVRFHAAQSTLFFGSVSIVLLVIKLLVSIPLLGFLLNIVLGPISWLITAVAFVAWLFLMIMAYRGVQVRLPYFGARAERWVGRK